MTSNVRITDLPLKVQGSILATSLSFYLACKALEQQTEHDTEEWAMIIEHAACVQISDMDSETFHESVAVFQKQVEALGEQMEQQSDREIVNRYSDIASDSLLQSFREESGNYIPVQIEPIFCLALIGQLQLALRHPQNVGVTSDTVREFVYSLIDKLAEVIPESRVIAMKGFDTRFDR